MELWDDKRKKLFKKGKSNKTNAFFLIQQILFMGIIKIKCPENITRKSLAIFYFTEEEKNLKSISTFYTTRSSDSIARKLIIFFDRQLVKIYSFLLRRFKIKNKTIEKLLLFFFSEIKMIQNKRQKSI